MIRNVLHRSRFPSPQLATKFRQRSFYGLSKFQKAAVATRFVLVSPKHGFVIIQKNNFSTFPISASDSKQVKITSEGEVPSLEWRMFYECGQTNQKLSPWHDIPLHFNAQSDLFNYVNEIPLGTRAKNEISTKEEHTPIKQDIKKGELRFFKYGDIPFNYGCLPQTWEDPNAVHKDTKLPGDNDPIDVCELSDSPIDVGAVEPVKLLGLLGLIDEGETDWKILAISSSHGLAAKLNDVSDVEKHMPGRIDLIRDWFKNYKVPDGKPQNSFSHNEEAQPRDYAYEIVEETHQSWKDLMDGSVDAGELHVGKKVEQ